MVVHFDMLVGDASPETKLSSSLELESGVSALPFFPFGGAAEDPGVVFVPVVVSGIQIHAALASARSFLSEIRCLRARCWPRRDMMASHLL